MQSTTDQHFTDSACYPGAAGYSINVLTLKDMHSLKTCMSLCTNSASTNQPGDNASGKLHGSAKGLLRMLSAMAAKSIWENARTTVTVLDRILTRWYADIPVYEFFENHRDSF